MGLSIAILKSFFHDQIVKTFRNAKRLLAFCPLPSFLLMIVGAAISVIIVSWLNSSRTDALETRNASQGEQISLCHSQAQSALETYSQDKQIKESIIQLYTILLAQKNINAGDLLHNLQPQNANHVETAKDVPPSPPPKPETLVVAQEKEVTAHQVEEKKGGFFDAISNMITDLAPHLFSDGTPSATVEVKDSGGRMTAQALAACVLMAANTYHVPAGVLVGVMHVQGGHIGEDVVRKDGSHDLGPLKINSKIVPTLSKTWNVSDAIATKWLRDDGCVNVHVAAWILRQKMDDAGSIWGGIAAYHSHNIKEGEAFAREVVSVMDKKGLVKHDTPNVDLIRDEESPEK